MPIPEIKFVETVEGTRYHAAELLADLAKTPAKELRAEVVRIFGLPAEPAKEEGVK